MDDTAVTGYGVYKNGSNVGSASAAPSTVSGLTCGTSYTFAVDAYDAAGNRSPRATVNATTSSCPSDTSPPTTPTNLVTSAITQTSVTLSWSPASDNVGVSGYGRYRNGSLLSSGTGTSYTFLGLACGTSYTLGVDAYDAAGNRSAKASVGAATSACSDTSPPTTPTSLATSGVNQSVITLSWGASSDNVGVSGYGRYRNGSLLSNGTGTSYTFSGLACGTSYTLTVDAYDAAGNRSAKASVSAATSACTAAPPGTANLWVDPSGGSCLRSALSAIYSDLNACGSFDAAWDAASAGDTIRVTNGIYPPQNITGDKAFDTFIIGESQSGTIVQRNGTVSCNGGNFGGDVIFCAHGAHMVMQNVRIDSGSPPNSRRFTSTRTTLCSTM